MVAKANMMLGQISRAFTYKAKYNWIRLYKTYVRPLLEYSPSVWAPWNSADIEKIEKVQERALRQCTELNGLTYNEKLISCKLTSLEHRRIRADNIQVWKILNKTDNVNESVWFTRYNQEGRLTRHRANDLNLRVPPSNLELRKNFFSTRAVTQWNQLNALQEW